MEMILEIALLLAMLPARRARCAERAHRFEVFAAAQAELSAEEWYANSATRARLTLLLAMDLCSSADGFLPEIFARPSYVGIRGEDLYVGVHGRRDSMLLAFRPAAGEAMCMRLDDRSGREALVEGVLRGVCGRRYRPNDAVELRRACEALMAMLDG